MVLAGWPCNLRLSSPGLGGTDAPRDRRRCSGANADLADRLDTDQWQVSRAGRRLRALGPATRLGSGRLNIWQLTGAGQRLAATLTAR